MVTIELMMNTSAQISASAPNNPLLPSFPDSSNPRPMATIPMRGHFTMVRRVRIVKRIRRVRRLSKVSREVVSTGSEGLAVLEEFGHTNVEDISQELSHISATRSFERNTLAFIL
jgi:hypothetical protein